MDYSWLSTLVTSVRSNVYACFRLVEVTLAWGLVMSSSRPCDQMCITLLFATFTAKGRKIVFGGLGGLYHLENLILGDHKLGLLFG
jgi:hypothetical protein